MEEDYTPAENYLIYLLGDSNTMIGKIVSNAFEVIAPPGRVTLFWVHELQRSEAVLQNMLVTNRGAVASNLMTAMKHKLIDFAILLHSCNQPQELIAYGREPSGCNMTSKQLNGRIN